MPTLSRKFDGSCLDVFKAGCKEWDRLEEIYNTPYYNPFGQLLRPEYCIHGVAYMWSDYETICPYCEEGIFSRTQWGKIKVDEYLRNRDRLWNKFLLEAIQAQGEKIPELMDQIGMGFFYKEFRRINIRSK